jgi:hypothetical protein
LAWLSTLAGILCLPLTLLLGLALFGYRAALLATAFSTVSTIQLALGRRALQDEVFCLAVLVVVYLLVRLRQSETGRASTGLLLLAIAALTVTFAVKESVLFLYPALVAFWLTWVQPRRIGLRDVLLFGLPPLLYYLVYCALVGNFTDFFRLTYIITSEMDALYARSFQAGPPHRLLFDMFVTSPLVSLLAAGAVLAVVVDVRAGRSARALALYVALALGVFSFLSSKNLRYVVMVDPMVRLLAAWFVVSAARPAVSLLGLGAIALANASIELEVFHRIFIERQVYDPTTAELLKALSAVPRPDNASGAMWYPYICAAIAAGWWLVSRRHTLRARLAARSPAALVAGATTVAIAVSLLVWWQLRWRPSSAALFCVGGESEASEVTAEPADPVARARWLVHAGLGPEALTLLEHIGSGGTPPVEARRLLLALYRARGADRELKQLLDRILAADATDAVARCYVRELSTLPTVSYDEAFRFGVAATNTGRHLQAAVAYRKAVELVPAAADALNNLGWARANLGFFPEAATAYREAIRARPDYALARNNLRALESHMQSQAPNAD